MLMAFVYCSLKPGYIDVRYYSYFSLLLVGGCIWLVWAWVAAPKCPQSSGLIVSRTTNRKVDPEHASGCAAIGEPPPCPSAPSPAGLGLIFEAPLELGPHPRRVRSLETHHVLNFGERNGKGLCLEPVSWACWVWAWGFSG